MGNQTYLCRHLWLAGNRLLPSSPFRLLSDICWCAAYDPITDFEVLNVGAYSLDRASDIAAKDEWIGYWHICCLADARIQWLDCNGFILICILFNRYVDDGYVSAYSDEDLTRSRLVVWCFVDFQVSLRGANPRSYVLRWHHE